MTTSRKMLRILFYREHDKGEYGKGYYGNSSNFKLNHRIF